MKITQFVPVLGGPFTVENANEIINSVNALYDLLESIYSKDIIVNTFADLQAYTFVSGLPIEITVVNDENKSRTNTFYKWTGSVLKWLPETDDEWQPTI